jgi:hypothetical protein
MLGDLIAKHKQQHSRLPWKFHEETAHRRAKVLDNGHLEICDVYGIDREIRNANAKLIVASVNSAEGLAEALRDMLSLVNDLGVTTSTTRDKAQDALAQFEKGAR